MSDYLQMFCATFQIICEHSVECVTSHALVYFLAVVFTFLATSCCFFLTKYVALATVMAAICNGIVLRYCQMFCYCVTFLAYF